MFSLEFYRRRRGESARAFLSRIVPALTTLFVMFGLPLLVVLALGKRVSVIPYVVENGMPAYLALIIGVPAGLLIADHISGQGRRRGRRR